MRDWGVQNYFETLSATVEAIVSRAAESRAVFKDDNDAAWELNRGHLSYGETRRHSIELASYKGKPTRKYFQAVIIRMDDGRYELTTYVL